MGRLVEHWKRKVWEAGQSHDCGEKRGQACPEDQRAIHMSGTYSGQIIWINKEMGEPAIESKSHVNFNQGIDFNQSTNLGSPIVEPAREQRWKQIKSTQIGVFDLFSRLNRGSYLIYLTK